MAVKGDKEIFQELIEDTPLCVKVFDNKGKLLYVSRGGREEHNLTAGQDVTKWVWEDTVKPEYRLQIDKQMQRALKDGVEGQVEFEHVPGTSNHQWCLGIISPIKQVGSSKVDYVLFYSADITLQKKAFFELKESELRYKVLLDAAPLCIKWFDNKGNLISVNAHGREEHFLAGKSEQEIKNWQYLSCIEPKYHQELKEKLAKALGGERQQILFEHVKGTGTSHWCESSLVPVKGADGGIQLLLFISRDVTSEKDKEEKSREESRLKNETIEQLKKFKQLVVGRELRMIELKDEIKKLKEQIKK